jgi:hypothetical protein
MVLFKNSDQMQALVSQIVTVWLHGMFYAVNDKLSYSLRESYLEKPG